jgi:hypothetical protein
VGVDCIITEWVDGRTGIIMEWLDDVLAWGMGMGVCITECTMEDEELG